jgi:hypothetical protein
VQVESDAVVLNYRAESSGSGEWKSVQQRVPIRLTACHLGGQRPWFVCSVYSNGRRCGRRSAILYGAGELFACRRCYGLPYQASRRRPCTAVLIGRKRPGCSRRQSRPATALSEKAPRNAPGNVHAASGARPLCTIRSQVTLKWLSPFEAAPPPGGTLTHRPFSLQDFPKKGDLSTVSFTATPVFRWLFSASRRHHRTS